MLTRFRVTDTAPPHVNGHRVKPGEVLLLSEAEAAYERDLGHIEAASDPVEHLPVAGLTDAEWSDLPALGIVAGGPALAIGYSRWSADVGADVTAAHVEADGSGAVSAPEPGVE